MKAFIVFLVVLVGLALLLSEGRNISGFWPRTLLRELKGWRLAYFTKTPLAGSSHAA